MWRWGYLKMWEKIIDEIKKNFRNPKRYIILIIGIIMFLFLFPYLDANIFYYNRVNNRIDILNKMSEIDMEKIQSNKIFINEYNSLLNEIEKQTEGNLGNILIKENNSTVNNYKFISGCIIFWFISIMCLKIKNIKTTGQRWLGFFLFAIIGLFFGVIARELPTIVTPIVNYIGFPFFIMILIALIVTENKMNK